ncbi:hypothetical protein ACFWAY_25115 [Rhodococcus sp. NPDC059968]|uniref:hypothetical protein n=1 Tax=Rhodococcus sp. NPDC059968 TaxID=3347017 RepID=UPI00366E4063
MASATAAEVLADPIRVIVESVLARDPTLGHGVVVEIAERIAGSRRAKRRRLAQALLDNPALLADGRSPAPRVVADLLIALRAAGARTVSPPVCAECGKQLRTIQRRGQDWYCGVCGPPPPEPCGSCGQLRRVSCRDREGMPRCVRCPPDDGDPLDVIVDVVTGVDAALSAQVVAQAVRTAVPRSSQRRALAWALQERPELLTGAGAEAPVPAVLRLLDLLCDAGATTIVHPACPGCDRVIHLHRPIDGKWLCRNCTAKSRAQPCARCGTVREAATRDERGRPLCPHCLTTDPANHEDCASCGRRRPVSVRTPEGPLCQNCRPLPTRTCSICGRSAPCEISMITSQPWCRACQLRWATCRDCGQTRPIRGGTLDEPLCATCACPDPTILRTCPTCGDPNRVRSGRSCQRCNLRRRLRGLLISDTGDIRPELQQFHDILAGHERPATVLRWLNYNKGSTALRQLATDARPLTHDLLDELPDGKPLEHLRSVLVSTGALPPRDENMVRLEQWITTTVAERSDPDQQQVLHRYAVWHVLRRLRGRLRDADTTHGQAASAQRIINAAIAFLDSLTDQGLTLATVGQGDLDAWMVSAKPSHRNGAGNFIRWARRQKLTSLDLPANRWSGPSGVIDTETRWQQARWLLHDDTVEPEDRVAGLLVLLYAQWPAVISRLTLDHVDTNDDRTLLRLGPEPVVVPDPLAGLIRQVVGTRRGHAVIGDQGTSAWLFPGGRPGRPISAERLAERLRQLGIRSGQSRSAALFQLATDLPAALLARMLGIHLGVAVAWQRASSGDWATYAAEISRRAPANGRHSDSSNI